MTPSCHTETSALQNLYLSYEASFSQVSIEEEFQHSLYKSHLPSVLKSLVNFNKK